MQCAPDKNGYLLSHSQIKENKLQSAFLRRLERILTFQGNKQNTRETDVGTRTFPEAVRNIMPLVRRHFDDTRHRGLPSELPVFVGSKVSKTWQFGGFQENFRQVTGNEFGKSHPPFSTDPEYLRVHLYRWFELSGIDIYESTLPPDEEGHVRRVFINPVSEEVMALEEIRSMLADEFDPAPEGWESGPLLDERRSEVPLVRAGDSFSWDKPPWFPSYPGEEFISYDANGVGTDIRERAATPRAWCSHSVWDFESGTYSPPGSIAPAFEIAVDKAADKAPVETAHRYWDGVMQDIAKLLKASGEKQLAVAEILARLTDTERAFDPRFQVLNVALLRRKLIERSNKKKYVRRINGDLFALLV